MHPYTNRGNGSGTMRDYIAASNLKKAVMYNNTPYSANIYAAVSQNEEFRLNLWKSEKLQLNIMSIPPSGSIGLEVHPDNDQFIYIEEGMGEALMGENRNDLYFNHRIYPGFGVIVPAGTWHNIKNTGKGNLKLFTLYAPSEKE